MIAESEAAAMPSDDDVVSVFELLALPTAAFVQTSYKIILGRLPDPVELKARASSLRAGQGRRCLLTDIVISPEFMAGQARLLTECSDEVFLTRVYRMYLDRTPDPDGMAAYLGALRKGRSRNVLCAEIATSREAKVVGSFWSELDLVVADERKAKAFYGRWLGRGRLVERRRNQEWEIASRPTVMSADRVNSQDLPRQTQRILSRLRHFCASDTHSGDVT